MIGLTSELAAAKVGRYDLVLIASRRAREIKQGWFTELGHEHGPIVTALKEVEAGLVGVEYLQKPMNIDRREKAQKSTK